MNKKLRHIYLKQKSNEIIDLKEDVNKLQNQLNAYKGLPPVIKLLLIQDINLAKLKIAQQKQENNVLNQQFQEHVNHLIQF